MEYWRLGTQSLLVTLVTLVALVALVALLCIEGHSKAFLKTLLIV
jgi:hypothetical protein